MQKKSRTPAVALRQVAKHLRRTYALDPETFDAMVASQNNRCAICDKDMGQGRRRHVDHCHETGRVRALLCNHCNCALGHAEHDPDRLRAMADYIEQHRLNGDTT